LLYKWLNKIPCFRFIEKESANAMLTGTWNSAKLALAARGAPEVHRHIDGDADGGINVRMKAETAAGSLPGAAAPQPFAPLLATPGDFSSDTHASQLLYGQNVAGSMLGWFRELKTERAVAEVAQEIARITRSYAFSQFIIAAAAVRRDNRLGKALSLVFDDKVEPFDQKFWLRKKAEAGNTKGDPFYFNIRTGVSTHMRPSFIRKREKEAEPAYIRIW
jgi:hypothetical protein